MKEKGNRSTYAKRSMIGAQPLLEMRARRSRRAFSISFRYAASTTGPAIRASWYRLAHFLSKEREKKNKQSHSTEQSSAPIYVYLCVCIKTLMNRNRRRDRFGAFGFLRASKETVALLGSRGKTEALDQFSISRILDIKKKKKKKIHMIFPIVKNKIFFFSGADAEGATTTRRVDDTLQVDDDKVSRWELLLERGVRYLESE